MDLLQLKEKLRPWIRVSTWDTGHPLDDERFHKALHDAFSSLGTSIHADDFEQAMLDLLNEIYPTKAPIDRSPRVERFVKIAERIGSYLHDTQHL